MTPDQISKSWYRDKYFISTNRGLLQLESLNAAFDSDLLWWATKLPAELLKKSVDNSLCLGLYVLPESTLSMAGKSNPEMVGFARIITDYVTFGYLTDVYVLKEHQGKGLGRWLMECLDEVLREWPALRRFLLLTSTSEASRLYQKTLGAVEWNDTPSSKLILLEKRGAHLQKAPE